MREYLVYIELCEVTAVGAGAMPTATAPMNMPMPGKTTSPAM